MTEITNIETEILKKVESLNIDTYAMFCKLTRYKDKLTEPAYKFMADKLFMLYREEFDRIFAPYEIERAQEKYRHKKRRGKFAPRETWFLHRKNLAAKFFIDGVTEEANGFFAAFKKKLAEIKRRRPVRRFFRRIFKRGKPASEMHNDPQKEGLHRGDRAPLPDEKSPKIGKGK